MLMFGYFGFEVFFCIFVFVAFGCLGIFGVWAFWCSGICFFFLLTDSKCPNTKNTQTPKRNKYKNTKKYLKAKIPKHQHTQTP
jgi:hypothetical protein